MKLYISTSNFHHMNKQALNEIISHLNIQVVSDITSADVIYSPAHHLNTESYPDKVYIFGPHFSVFPNDAVRRISNRFKNAVYIQPSQPTVDTWLGEFSITNLPVKAFPFPLNLDRYPVSTRDKDTVLLYYKQRDPLELSMMENFLKAKKIKYELVSYGLYSEGDYQEKLDRSRYVVWVGRHESQGFALQSALAKNIPILVWSTRQRHQELGCPQSYYSVKSEVTTVPYWDGSCGVKFHDSNELDKSFQEFTNNLDSYTPRKFIEDNLTIQRCSDNFINLVEEIKREMSVEE